MNKLVKGIAKIIKKQIDATDERAVIPYEHELIFRKLSIKCANHILTLINDNLPAELVVDCPECEGTGKRTISFNPNLNPNSFEGSAVGVLNCYKCLGTGNRKATLSNMMEEPLKVRVRNESSM